jgi:hypothetical protein
MDHLALGIALLSYDGRIHWGFNADWDVVPDLDDFVHDTKEALAELLRAARPARRGRARSGENEPS